MIIEQVIFNYLALPLLFSVKSHVLFTVYYSEPDLNNELFICLCVFLQCSSQHLNALQTLSDSFSRNLCVKVNNIIVCTLQKGRHDMGILKHLLIPSVQMEVCTAKFLQNTYICHIIWVSFSSTCRSYPKVWEQAPRKLGIQSWSHDHLKTFCI